MSRLTVVFVVVALAACGGKSKPAQVAPLPDDPKTAAKPEPPKPAPAPVPEKPPEPVAGPVDLKIPAAQTKVKLVSAGKGKKEALHYSAKAGAKQKVEVALDFGGKQDEQAEVIPTIVLVGDVETKTVDKDGKAEYTLTVSGTDAREVKGSNAPIEEFKKVLAMLSGVTIGGTMAANGVAGETTIHLDKTDQRAAQALELIRLTLPALPVLPTEAVAVGAKWQATTIASVAEKLEVTQTTDYELVAHKGTTWTIKGTTKVTGKDQEVDDGKISDITGNGASEATIADGTLYPAYRSALETVFKASEKPKGSEAGMSSVFVIRVANMVTPKTP